MPYYTSLSLVCGHTLTIRLLADLPWVSTQECKSRSHERGTSCSRDIFCAPSSIPSHPRYNYQQPCSDSNPPRSTSIMSDHTNWRFCEREFITDRARRQHDSAVHIWCGAYDRTFMNSEARLQHYKSSHLHASAATAIATLIPRANCKRTTSSSTVSALSAINTKIRTRTII